MNCNMIQPANITFTPSLGSAASPFSGILNITQRLCYPCCVGATPVFAPQFSVRNITQVGDGLYAFTLHAEGIISYVSGSGGCKCTRQQPLSADVAISVESATVPAISINAPAGSINALDAQPCKQTTRTFVCDTPLSITVATAATASGNNAQG